MLPRNNLAPPANDRPRSKSTIVSSSNELSMLGSIRGSGVFDVIMTVTVNEGACPFVSGQRVSNA